MRDIKILQTTNNSKVYKQMRKRFIGLYCTFCPPHKGENLPRRTPRSDKYKVKRGYSKQAK